MNYRLSTYLLLFLSLFSWQIVNAQTIYRWVDSRGQVHYTQLKPEEAVDQQIDAQNAANAAQIPQVANQSRPSTIKVEAFEASKTQLLGKEKQPIKPSTINESAPVAKKETALNSVPVAETPITTPSTPVAVIEPPNTPKEKKEETISEQPKVTEIAVNDFCVIARQNLKTFEAYKQGEFNELKLVDENGQESLLTQTQINEQIEHSKKGIEANCM